MSCARVYCRRCKQIKMHKLGKHRYACLEMRLCVAPRTPLALTAPVVEAGATVGGWDLRGPDAAGAAPPLIGRAADLERLERLEQENADLVARLRAAEHAARQERGELNAAMSAQRGTGLQAWTADRVRRLLPKLQGGTTGGVPGGPRREELLVLRHALAEELLRWNWGGQARAEDGPVASALAELEGLGRLERAEAEHAKASQAKAAAAAKRRAAQIVALQDQLQLQEEQAAGKEQRLGVQLDAQLATAAEAARKFDAASLAAMKLREEEAAIIEAERAETAMTVQMLLQSAMETKAAAQELRGAHAAELAMLAATAQATKAEWLSQADKEHQAKVAAALETQRAEHAKALVETRMVLEAADARITARTDERDAARAEAVKAQAGLQAMRLEVERRATNRSGVRKTHALPRAPRPAQLPAVSALPPL